jgi:hypothetical protein
MYHAKAIKFALASLLLVCSVGLGSVAKAQEPEAKKVEATNQKTEAAEKKVRNGRDPFSPYRVPVVTLRKVGPVAPPTIQERIEQYRAQKLAAMNAHLAAPKPTTALLLNEIQVVGISRTPRGYAAIVQSNSHTRFIPASVFMMAS